MLLYAVCVYFIIELFAGSDLEIKFFTIFQWFALLTIILALNDLLTFVILNGQKGVLAEKGVEFLKSPLYFAIRIKNVIGAYIHLIVSLATIKLIYKVSLKNFLWQIILLSGVFLIWHWGIFKGV